MRFPHRRGAAAAAVCASVSILGWSLVAARGVEQGGGAVAGAREAAGTHDVPYAPNVAVARGASFVALLEVSVGAATAADDSVRANAAVVAHEHFWRAQQDSGRVLLAGEMRGDDPNRARIIVFRAPSHAEAERLVAADPGVRAQVFSVKVRSFDVHFSPVRNAARTK